MTKDEAIALLDTVRWEHDRNMPDGIFACPCAGLVGAPPEECDCGATKANDAIDAVIAWIRELPHVCSERVLVAASAVNRILTYECRDCGARMDITCSDGDWADYCARREFHGLPIIVTGPADA